MWRNWNPLNPPINEQSSDEDLNNYESAGENDPNNLVSPNRPHQSPSASPRALLRPDPPAVEEVLQEVQQQLQALPDRQQRAANRNAVRQRQEAAAAAAVSPAEPIRNEVVNMVDFETENGVDGDKAQEHARSIKIEFEPADIKFWFAQLEGEMTMASVKSQWLKRTVLQRNLPNKQKEDVKALLTLNQTEAGNDIYLKIKRDLIRIYAQKPEDSYKKALGRAMVGLPSQLGLQIVDDICKKVPKLEGCCCAGAALAIWSMALPVNIRAHISDKEFTPQTYKSVFETADKVYLSSKNVTVASITKSGAAADSLDETLPAFSTQNQPQVAAVNRGNNRGQRGWRGGRGQRGQRGNGRGGQQRGGGQSSSSSSNSNRGPRHHSNPPESCCDRHYRHGDQSYFCLAPLTCPWVTKVIAKP